MKKDSKLKEWNKMGRSTFEKYISKIQWGLEFVSKEKDEYRKAEVMRWICRRARSLKNACEEYEDTILVFQNDYKGEKDKLKWTYRGKFEFESDEK